MMRLPQRAGCARNKEWNLEKVMIFYVPTGIKEKDNHNQETSDHPPFVILLQMFSYLNKSVCTKRTPHCNPLGNKLNSICAPTCTATRQKE